jgi:hypothetical protein
MSDVKFPHWFFGPDGAEMICQSADEIPAGWVKHPALLAEAKASGKVVVIEKPVGVDGSRFDHNGDGLPGGSAAPEKTDRLKELRAEYQALIGKRAFPGWDEAEIERRMAAHKPEPEIDTTEF